MNVKAWFAGLRSLVTVGLAFDLIVALVFALGATVITTHPSSNGVYAGMFCISLGVVIAADVQRARAMVLGSFATFFISACHVLAFHVGGAS